MRMRKMTFLSNIKLTIKAFPGAMKQAWNYEPEDYTDKLIAKLSKDQQWFIGFFIGLILGLLIFWENK